MKNPRAGRVRLGEFEVDLGAGELFVAGDDQRKILLRQQPFEILRMLIEADGEIITRQEIKKKLWPNDTIVNFDHSINVAIGILRRVMGDSADNPQYIETLARRGYRLRVGIEWQETERETVLPGPLSHQSPPKPAGLIGTKVSHYRVLDFIGAGGMGMVYKAEDLKLSRRVALKFLPEELADDPLALKRFEREAQTASALNHPNICTIYQIDEYDGQPFIAMELLEGDSLLHWLATPETKAIPLDSILDIAIQICDGLQAAHDGGIIHRDIKPGNLFLTPRGQVKILDFGLAKAVTAEELGARNLTEASDAFSTTAEQFANDGEQIPTAGNPIVSVTEPAMGTTGYMSPEQLRKEQLDPRTDLFSFGVVLYEMAAGRRPFEGDTLSVVHDAILTQTLVPASEANPAVPRRLSAIIAKATEKDRSRRYHSAPELRADLEIVRQELRPARAHTRKWVVAGALIALVALAIGVYWRSFGRTASALTPNQTILIAINNQTRDPVFSDALFGAVQIAMEQTPYFTLLPLTKAAPAMNALHLSGDPMRLSPQAARLVCVQTGSKLVIANSIVEAGNGFDLKLEAIECRSGRILATVSGEAPSRADVVHTLGLQTAELRAKLGEPAASIAKFNKPLETAASASLEALQVLQEGYKRHLASDASGAISSYQRALELDPNLAGALTGLAAAQQFLGDDASAISAITKAYALRERLTDSVRLRVESNYYSIVTGEKEKVCELLSQAVRRFPDDFIFHNNLRYCLISIGQLDRALAEAREASRLYPSSFSYHSLTSLEITTDRLDEAEADLAEADARKFDSVYLREGHAILAFLKRDQSKMQEQWKWAEGKPEAYFVLLQRALVEAYYGHYSNYRRLSAQVRDFEIKENAALDNSWSTAEDSLTEAEAGNRTQALRLAEDGVNKPQFLITRPILALAFARAGQIRRAQEFAEALNKDNPVNTEIQNYLLPTIQAAIKIRAKDPAEAIKILERTRRYQFACPDSFEHLYPAYIRGLAYLQIGEGSLARTEFQRLLDHPGMVKLNVIGALSRLQMGRALRMSGDTAAARKSYEEFLTLWKTADPDIPIYQEAKAEYAQLSSDKTAR